ncbi:MAG: type II secretion system F family protein [Desulfurococcaceae archaeon]
MNKVLDLLLRRAYLFGFVVVFNAIVVSLITIHVPYPMNVVLGAMTVVGSVIFVIYYTGVKRLGGIVPISDDLTFILVHMRCLVTSNPATATLFQKIGETDFYKKKYREIYSKVYTLTKNWGYSLPESLRLVSKETPSKIEEQFFQRFSAIVSTGGDVKEYLRLEYNTLFSEYRSGYGRMVDTLRVVLGVYTTLIGALTFLVATLLLLGMLFGGAMELVLTALMGMTMALLTMSVLMYFVIRRPLFEYKKTRSTLVRLIGFLGVFGTVFFVLIIMQLVITGNIMELEITSLYIALGGAMFLPAGILVKIHENRITEYDMFYPAFIRSYGEHMAVVPNLLESLKPLLVAELGKLRKLLNKVYAGLVNRIDPRLVWKRVAVESGSELVVRASMIFMDTVELGGDTGESGALLSDHLNELFRMRLSYIQVFKTFEITLYVMHAIAVVLLIFVGGFINLFSNIISQYAIGIPAEFAGLFAFFSIRPVDISLMINISALALALSNTMALISVNPGSRYAVYYYLSVMLMMTGMGIYLGSFVIKSLLESFLMPLA